MGLIKKNDISYGGGGGAALPTGGTTGQALVKKSDADGDTEWRDIGGGNVPAGYEPLTITMTDGNGVTHTYEVLGKEVTP